MASPEDQRPDRLSRREANGAKHPSDAAGKKGDNGPDRQQRREQVQTAPDEKVCWHFGHAMVTYAFNP